MKRRYVYAIIILVIANALFAKPGCQQIGNRLSMRNDAKNFSFVQCSCPCDEYPQLPKSQCSECKHYHLQGHASFEFLKPDIEEAHRLYLQENSKD